MSFRVEEPQINTERMRCPECRRRFWAGEEDKGHRIRVGIFSADAKRIDP